MKILSGYYKQISIIFILLNVSALAISEIATVNIVHSTYWYSNIFFFLIILISHLISSQGLKSVGDFHMFYFASMAVRFMLALIYIFSFAFFGVENQIAFVLNFMYLYLIYTSFEIYTLIRNLRTDYK